jgi:phospholipid N-methyltransferase
VPKRAPSRRKQLALFALNFFKHPKMLGSIIPSSRFLIDKVLRQVEWERARVIVEYGPGVGTFTHEVLRRMRADGILMVIETNPEFVEFLRESIPDRRLRVIHGSAADVGRELEREGVKHADYVISGIPFTTLPPQVREDVLRETRRVLEPDGVFLVYQFSPKVLGYLKPFFRVTREFEPWNILPAQLFYCRP